ncbi:PREDICTED: histidine protein methyltransferase 1 homolog [Amphimedon queenslandica]|uniref:protein-histidine N-methyltransferase n=1 Tax=Amphimedon queenslandica TaxID=400682 RepID=A0A1X7VW68_AMPQE|nr:PREDICTED: histidine protein methyltransferase 1 homolog [Amphimedon queenslandica]|eukprot:XP_003382692.1 PREDICTED: histidine protein methyltransferase 1 homolog [Amphimedon queenslandica]
MAAFRFDFFPEDAAAPINEEDEGENVQSICKDLKHNMEEHYFNQTTESLINTHTISRSIKVSKGTEIHCINCSDIGTGTTESTSISNLISITDREGSDLIPGVYEGGLKIWECTHDLLMYLSSNNVDFTGKCILDLGCGAGLLGIHALLNKAREVHFQDYNSEVIDYLTIPNVTLNISKEHSENSSVFGKTRFFSGKWSDFKPLDFDSNPMQYDIILTSETIYNSSSHAELLNVLYRHLDKRGFILVAAKTHYFGVGGTLGMFTKLIAQDEVLSHDIVQETATSVPRIIMELRYN